MTENLTIKEGKNTPKVTGNKNLSELIFKGNSYPENVLQFYTPILNWVESLSSEKTEIKVECQFYYIASSSVIAFLKLLQKIESSFNKENISFTWKYEEGDDDIKKIGQDYSTILDTPIKIIEVEES
ncbi:MAG: SiaC family regulatory phosphoprotein [Flavobacteriales bacterium]|nr:SiaC family regulatory phosphoprotein [Flavobacteriales bacterium]